MAIKIRLRGNLDEWREAWQRYPARMRAAMVRGFNRAGEVVARDAARRIAASGSDGYTSVFTGTLLRAMSAGWKVHPETLTLRIGPHLAAVRGTGQNYGAYVEFGRRPGKPPPARALMLWARRKLGTPESELFAVVRSLRRSIARRGTVASPFLFPAVRDNVGAVRAAIEGAINAEVDKINGER